MKNKKGETESYSFLIGLVITFLLLTSVGCVVYQLYSKKSETEENFKSLAETVKNLKEGEEGKIPFYIDEDYVVVGFRSDQPTVESKATVGKDFFISYCYNWYTGGYDGLLIERPEQCKGKSCICLCQYKTDAPKQLGTYEKIRGAAIFVTRNFCSGKEDTCITEGVDKYDFAGAKACSIAFIPGVKGRYFAGIEPLRTQTKIDQRGTAPVYYKRSGNTIFLGDEQPTKEEINTEIQKTQDSEQEKTT